MHDHSISTFVCRKCRETRSSEFLSKRPNTCQPCYNYRPGNGSLSAHIYRYFEAIEFRKSETRPCPQCAKPVLKTGNRDRDLYCRECFAESRSRQRERKAERLGKVYVRGGSAARKRHDYPDIERARLERKVDQYAKRNAEQAFDYWLKVKASDETVRLWYELSGKPWLNPRLSDAEQYRLKYALNPEFQLSERIRRQMNKKAKRDGVAELIRGAIRRGGKSNTVERMLGYSIAELRHHLERQFTKGMTWDRFMRGDIHIDHIVPQCEFVLSDDDEWRRCWCLTNLMPLWANDNLAKRDKRVSLL